MHEKIVVCMEVEFEKRQGGHFRDIFAVKCFKYRGKIEY